MKFTSIEQFLQGLEKKEIFHHDIKGKRLRKQLKSLDEMDNEDFSFDFFEIRPTSMVIHLNVPVSSSELKLEMRLDYEYPFNQPQIFYNQKKNSHYRYCKDLLQNILQGQNWGPSLTLPVFLEKIASLAKKIHSREQLQWQYHLQYEYGSDELASSGVKLYAGEEYKWDFKVIKNTRKKTFGLTPDCLLIFEEDSDILKLEFWSPINELAQVKATIGKPKYSLEIELPDKNKIYLGGNFKDIDEILSVLNPIEVYEKKVQTCEKSGEIENHEEMVRMYSALIEHYSLKDMEKTQRYMKNMKKIISAHYSEAQEYGKQQKMVEIQT